MRVITTIAVQESLDNEGNARFVLPGEMNVISEKESVLLIPVQSELVGLATAPILIQATPEDPEAPVELLSLMDHEGNTVRADSVAQKIAEEGLTGNKGLPLRVVMGQDPRRIRMLSRLPSSAYLA